MSEELAARLMARIAVPPMPFAPDTYTAGRMDQFTEMITQLRALPEVDKEQVLADVKARIEDLHYGDDNLLIGTGYQLAVNDALAALTQPQTERCPEDCDGFGQLIGDSDGPCPACSGLESDGGGAAAAAGVADADLEGDEPSETEAVARVKAVMKAGRDAGSGVFDSNSVFRFGTHGVAALLNFLERDGWEVIHTGVYAQPQKWIQAEAELEDQPGPYAKAFREKFPVPEFPGIKNRQEDQA